jgi:hypothetical protein
MTQDPVCEAKPRRGFALFGIHLVPRSLWHHQRSLSSSPLLLSE